MIDKMQEFGEIEIIDGSPSNKYNCVQAVKTFKHKDYCCPFCSHGETVQFKVYTHYRGRLQGTYIRAYIECSETCMSYGLFERSFCHGWTEEEKIENIMQKGIEVFKKLILFTKDMTDFITVKPLQITQSLENQ